MNTTNNFSIPSQIQNNPPAAPIQVHPSQRYTEEPIYDYDFSEDPLQSFMAQPSPSIGFIEELSPSSSWTSSPPSPPPIMTTAISSLFTTHPPLHDAYPTTTSIVQDETINEVLPYLTGQNAHLFISGFNSHGVPTLQRSSHISFLKKILEGLPAPYTAADAGRPWFFYWCLNALSILGEDVSCYRSSLIASVRACQHPEGGFGGGHGQLAHLAPSYAIILSLALVGGGAVECVDREGMWRFLGRCKQVEGGFSMSVGGEVDVRGAFCAAVMICLLGLPVDMPVEERQRVGGGVTLLSGLAEWVGKCQTFEGGISSRPDAEAHGAYAFCALACLSILGPPATIIPKYLDIPLLVSWMSARQYGPEGGFAGRTNKLVDGCYSHWIGGCWPIIEAVLQPASGLPSDKSIYSREGLIRYILCCCQETKRKGGLRDKPSKNPDAYHTCYVLAGLSTAQHSWRYDYSNAKPTEVSGLTAPFQFRRATDPTYEDQISGEQVFDEESRVEALHPVFVVPEGRAEDMRKWCIENGSWKGDIQ